MIEKHPLSTQRIIDCLNTAYGLEIAMLTFLPLGADSNASVYKAQAHGSSYFVKIKSGQNDDISLTLLTLLHDAGIQQIIPPIKTIYGQLTQPIDGYSLIVYPFVEGKDGFSTPLTKDQWILLGKVLRRVHEFHVPASIQEKIRGEAYSPKWRQMVRSLYAQIDTIPTGDEVALMLIKFLKERREVIQHLVDRAEQLSQKIQNLSPQYILCHSDIHGGNVLIEDSGALYIVDWDDPIMAPKERDLMFIGGGVANVWNDPQETDFFYEGYGVTHIDKAIMAYYRYERIVEDIADFAEELLCNTVNNKDRSEMYKQFMGMFMKRGVVDIALKTDKGRI